MTDRDDRLKNIRIAAFYWGTWKLWKEGDKHKRQFGMKLAMADLVMQLAEYRAEMKGAIK